MLQFNYNVRTIRLAAQEEHWQQAQHCLPSMVLTLEQVHSLPAARQEQQEQQPDVVESSLKGSVADSQVHVTPATEQEQQLHRQTDTSIIKIGISYRN